MDQAGEIRRKTGYHHGDLRTQLVEATRALVEEKGPDHFSVSEACRKAGVSTAAPYRHFKDRDEMLDAVCFGGMERHYTAMVSALEGIPKGDIRRIEALGRVYVGFALDEPGVFRLVFGSKHRDGTSIEEAEMNGVRPYELVKEEVAAVLGRSEVDADAERRSFLLWTFVHGLSFLLIDEVTSQKGVDVDIDAVLADIGRLVFPEIQPRG
ncbi:TetR family transcriptional regulator [Rhodobacterales bacterium HKCCE3408]|nr:TetR family transcriptional regulator [Rhodobacterales bacterium HKCCE3408]